MVYDEPHHRHARWPPNCKLWVVVQVCNSSLVRRVICLKVWNRVRVMARGKVWVRVRARLGLGLELVRVRAMVRVRVRVRAMVRVRFSVIFKNLHNYISDNWPFRQVTRNRSSHHLQGAGAYCGSPSTGCTPCFVSLCLFCCVLLSLSVTHTDTWFSDV